MTGSVYLNRCTCNCCAIDTGDERFRLRSLRADADGVGVVRNTIVADINIVIAVREILAGVNAQGDVVAAGCIVEERTSTVGSVPVADGVAAESISTISRVEVTGGVAD